MHCADYWNVQYTSLFSYFGLGWLTRRTCKYHNKPLIMTEFGADTMADSNSRSSVMWSEEYQADLIRGYLEVAVRKPFIAGMQGTGRVGGTNLKCIFTRARQPRMAAHVVREFWAK